MGSYKMFLRYAYHKSFMVKFPDKCEWQNRLNPETGGACSGTQTGPRPIKARGAVGLKKAAQLQSWTTC
jgi:hypothetical protein